eukprot:TRINITY_DN10705_c0_g1_i3.p2 TRINITY_DN10705_c0_g1~~TRINITY_DN10705_c0_g1_i3.p2  ORF type:complete len:135 (-),score=48.86 TRINITY_DN10705_c0_g1_i3:130-534(-)
MSRLVEIFECNPWANMTKRGKPSNSVKVKEKIEEPQAPKKEEPVPEPPKTDENADKKAEEAPAQPAKKSKKEHEAKDLEEEDEEMEKFDELFSKIAILKQNGKNLSDEDRKKQADVLFMQMMEYFDMDEDEEQE